MANLVYLKFLFSSQDSSLRSALGPVHAQLSPLLSGRNRCPFVSFSFFFFSVSFKIPNVSFQKLYSSFAFILCLLYSTPRSLFLSSYF